MMAARLLSLGLLLVPAIGCQPPRSTDATRDRAGDTPSTTAEFASRQHGIRLSYPADWSAIPNDEYALLIVPRDSKDAGTPKQSISLDVPKLPPHLPGFIPLGMVVNGYIDDLKKQLPGVRIEEPVAMKVAGANARRVRSAWLTKAEDAVLTVHGDRVYIFRANLQSGTDDDPREARDAILESVRWIP